MNWHDQESADVRQVLTALVRAIATVTPGAKLGATAPYAYSDFVLLESGTQQPRSLANAYLKALRPSGDLIQQAVSALAATLGAQEDMYGATAGHRTLATTCAWSGKPQREPLDQAIATILTATFGGGPHGHPAPAL
jgi:CRISPR system Cascade subunit CasC